MTTTKTLAVSAIKNGTVIDHIVPGQALAIVRLLNLAKHHKQVTLGLNLPSSTRQYKDIIKVEDRELTPEEANQVAIFSPKATINIIKDYEVVNKFFVEIPETISTVIRCPNPRCITNHEKMRSFFFVKQRMQSIDLQCKYCRKIFSQEEIEETSQPLGAFHDYDLKT